MNKSRIIIAMLVVVLVGAGTGLLGCSGGQIPYGDTTVAEEAGTVAPSAEGGAPTAPSVEVATPVVTEQEEPQPADQPGLPCLMNYVLPSDPDYILVIKINENILKVMDFIDFKIFSFLLDDPSIINDLVGYADELVIASGPQGTVVLVRIKGELIESGKTEQDFEGLFIKLKDVVKKAEYDQASTQGTPPSELVAVHSQLTHDSSAYAIGLESTLTKIVDLKVDEECNYCTIGACGVQSVPMMYLTVKGATFHDWLMELFSGEESLLKTLEEPFGSARFVMGVDVDAEKAATSYSAIFEGKDCTQEGLLAANSSYVNVTKGFGKDLLNAIISGVLSVDVIEEGAPGETTCESNPQIVALKQQLTDLEAQLQQALDAHDLARVQGIQGEIDTLTNQINDLLAQMGCPPLGGLSEQGVPSSAPSTADAALLISLCNDYNNETDPNQQKLIENSILTIEQKYGLHGTCQPSGSTITP